MLKFLAVVGVATLWVSAFCQGGQGGFGGGGGQGGLQGGTGQRPYDRSVQAIEAAISTYVVGDEIKNILTPGEYSEWPLTLKAGQVVIAEARSDAFDPALEVTDEKGKVLGSSDDRYPGDQRPLLLWRCEQDGKYSLRGRCFHDKSGGQFFLRFKAYECVDLMDDKPSEQVIEDSGPMLFRIPMKAGQIKQFYATALNQSYRWVSVQRVISPIGLPDISLAAPLAEVAPNSILAPVDGDYYWLAEAGGMKNAKVHAFAKEIAPIAVTDRVANSNAKVATLTPTVWTINAKAGELLEAATPGLDVSNAHLVIAAAPDVSKYDLKKPESNPFYPQVKDAPAPTATIVNLPGRSRDERVSVFAVVSDAKIMIASDGSGAKGASYALKLGPAAKDFTVALDLAGKLEIGRTDYWTFDAKVGDVMTFMSTASNFSERIDMRDPDLQLFSHKVALPDQSELHDSITITRPGRYIVSVGCVGDGGGGAYILSRKVFQAKEFTKTAPAAGEISAKQVQVWKFTVNPNEPMLIRWKSSNWEYSISSHDQDGAFASLPLTVVDDNNRYGILRVNKPTTYTIVLVGTENKASYSIELSPLPGYKGKG